MLEVEHRRLAFNSSASFNWVKWKIGYYIPVRICETVSIKAFNRPPVTIKWSSSLLSTRQGFIPWWWPRDEWPRETGWSINGCNGAQKTNCAFIASSNRQFKWWSLVVRWWMKRVTVRVGGYTVCLLFSYRLTLTCGFVLAGVDRGIIWGYLLIDWIELRWKKDFLERILKWNLI